MLMTTAGKRFYHILITSFPTIQTRRIYVLQFIQVPVYAEYSIEKRVSRDLCSLAGRIIDQNQPQVVL